MTDFDNPVKTVTKRNGEVEPFDAMKTIKWGEWAARKLGNRVQWHKIAKAVLQQAYDGIATSKLHNFYIDECLRRGDWAHNVMAGGLWAPILHKELYGDVIPTVAQHHKKLQDRGLMKVLPYSEEEYTEIDKMIDHTRDYDMAQFQIKQNFRKYAIKDAVSGKSFESPQFIFMRMAMEFSSKRPKTTRLEDVKNFYEEFSINAINAPTPNYLNAGTKLDGYVSCCLYTTDDNIPSLSVGEHIAYRMTAIGAGIGAFIRARGLGEGVRGGAIEHNGKTPYYNAQAGTIKANMQSGRAGAGTTYYNIFDVEAGAIAQLQDPRAPEDKRNRNIHFAASYHSLFIKKAALNEDVFTFSCQNAPDLFEAFYGKDLDLFEELYNKYAKDDSFKKNWISARDLLVMTEQQGPNIGTHYDFFVSNANTHTPFKEPIFSSNLCMEVMEVTKGYKDSDQLHKAEYHGIIKFTSEGKDEIIPQNTLCWFVDENDEPILETEFPAGELEEGMVVKTVYGKYSIDKILIRDQQPEVALCSLGGIVESNIRDDTHYERAMYYTQVMIDYCIHNSSYPFAHIAFTAKKRLNAGIGLLGAATTLAREKLHYDTQEGLAKIHRMAERHMYFAIKCSIQLGREMGNAPWINKTYWPQGWLPIDTYKRSVDEVCNEPLVYDWEELRGWLIAQKGMRFSCLVAHMPTESSSKAAGVPNSWYPVRMVSMAKSDANNIIEWTAMDSDLIGQDYQLAYTIKVRDMIKVYAVIQKFTDQGISADLYVDRSRTLDISAKELLENVILMQKLGLKSRYYVNSKTDDAGDEAEVGCASGACTL